MLIIDCCPRGDESRTRNFYRAFLEKYNKSGDTVFVCDEDIPPLDSELLEIRDAYIESGDFSASLFDYAKKFRDADEILIAAPYWDLLFPAQLKSFLEQVSVANLTFRYTENGSEGLCRAKKLYYFSTLGGFADVNLGYEYVKSFSAMLGIENTEYRRVEGLDVDPEKSEAILASAISEL